MFLCNCCSTTPLPILNEQAAVMAQQVTQRRQSGDGTIAKVKGLPWSPNGSAVITQWTLLVGQRRNNGGTMKEEASLELIPCVFQCQDVRLISVTGIILVMGSQWETTLHCNVVSRWLSAYPEWSLCHCVGTWSSVHSGVPEVFSRGSFYFGTRGSGFLETHHRMYQCCHHHWRDRSLLREP